MKKLLLIATLIFTFITAQAYPADEGIIKLLKEVATYRFYQVFKKFISLFDRIVNRSRIANRY